MRDKCLRHGLEMDWQYSGPDGKEGQPPEPRAQDISAIITAS